MNIYTEYTPNPETLKFVLGKTIMENGATADFPNEESAVKSPLAKELFAMPFVEGVFFGKDFVTVTKNPANQWEDIIPLISGEIEKYMESGKPLLSDTASAQMDETETDPVVIKIKKLINETIRPAVAMDGGDILFESFDADTGTVNLKMHGSCSGCPSSTVTLKAGIENLLTRMVPEVKEVNSVAM